RQAVFQRRERRAPSRRVALAFLPPLHRRRMQHHTTSIAPSFTLTLVSLTTTFLAPRSIVIPSDASVILLLDESVSVIVWASSSRRILQPCAVTMIFTVGVASAGISPSRQ